MKTLLSKCPVTGRIIRLRYISLAEHETRNQPVSKNAGPVRSANFAPSVDWDWWSRLETTPDPASPTLAEHFAA